MKTSTSVRTFVLEDLGDRRLESPEWDRMLAMGDTNTVFLTPEWQRAWWKVFHPGAPLFIVAEKEGQPVAFAPMFALGGMAFLGGSGSSDYLDFIGNIDEPDVLDGILQTARESIDDFVGFRFHHVPEASRTGRLLAESADRLGLSLFNEGSIPVPVMTMGTGGSEALAAAQKKSLVRHERFFDREGRLEIRHFTRSGDIAPHLDSFFDEHIARWAVTDYPSLFLDDKQRLFYEELVVLADRAGWLRFTRVDWNEAPIAFHFGFHHGGRYLWYKPSFDIELARRSPGEVLLRNLLLAAVEEKAAVFDFGLGDEPFKSRFATRVENVHTWALYTPNAVREAEEGPP